MILLLQSNSENDSAEIIFDKQGLQLLRTLLNKDWKEPVQKNNEYFDFDHEHLASKVWGGEELTPEFSSPDSNKFQSVKITYVGENGEQLLGE